MLFFAGLRRVARRGIDMSPSIIAYLRLAQVAPPHPFTAVGSLVLLGEQYAIGL